MSKANWLYVSLFAALAAGIWVIVTIGGSIRAPTDIAGNWELHWEATPADHLPTQLHIDQSGLFVAATIDARDQFSGRMSAATRPDAYALVLQPRAARASAALTLPHIPQDVRPARLAITLDTAPPLSGTATRQLRPRPSTSPTH
jgi:hypothetical protein